MVRIPGFHCQVQVQSLVRELRPCKLYGAPKQTKQKGEIFDQMVHKRRYMAGPALLASTTDLGWVSSYLLSEVG